ncbi:ABC transporter ATP-binding protein, partial [Rhizobium leguminosarum]
GRKFQIPSVFRDLTVRQNLEVSNCLNPSVLANLRFVFSRAEARRVDDVLALIGLDSEHDVMAAYLSSSHCVWPWL